MSPTISPEHAILAAALTNPDSLPSVLQQQKNWQWKDLIAAASAERVLPLVWSALQPHAAAALGDSTQKIQQRVWQLNVKNTFLQTENRRLLQVATAQFPQNSKLVLLKGSHLQDALYAPRGLIRPMNDIDWWIDSSDLPAMRDALISVGMIRNPRGHEEFTQHEESFRNEPDTVVVELHWRLLGGETDHLFQEMDWFWQRTEPLTTFNNVHALTPTANFLYLAAHCSFQGHDEPVANSLRTTTSSKLLWYFDLHLLLGQSGESIDWQAILAYAARHRWMQMVVATLETLQSFFDSPLPMDFLATVRARVTAADRRTYQRRGPNGTASRWGLMDRFADQNWAGKMALARGYLFPEPSKLRAIYPSLQNVPTPLLYGYRFWRLLSRFRA